MYDTVDKSINERTSVNNYFGPPPLRPTEPRMVYTMHAAHFLGVLFTAGLWAIVWLAMTLINDAKNRQLRTDYAAALARWEYDLWHWEQARYEYFRWAQSQPVQP